VSIQSSTRATSTPVKSIGPEGIGEVTVVAAPAVAVHGALVDVVATVVVSRRVVVVAASETEAGASDGTVARDTRVVAVVGSSPLQAVEADISAHATSSGSNLLIGPSSPTPPGPR